MTITQINTWLPYPQNKPQEDDTSADFVVLSPNANRINKNGFHNTAPKYCALQAIWNGTGFVNNLWQPLIVAYYFQLPPFPKEAADAN